MALHNFSTRSARSVTMRGVADLALVRFKKAMALMPGRVVHQHVGVQHVDALASGHLDSLAEGGVWDRLQRWEYSGGAAANHRYPQSGAVG